MPNLRKTYKAFTTREIALMREKYLTTEIGEFAKLLPGHTVGSIIAKAYQLGFRKGKTKSRYLKIAQAHKYVIFRGESHDAGATDGL